MIGGEAGPQIASRIGSDPFDAHAEHLLLRVAGEGSNGGPIVVSCRVLTPAGARAVGGLAMETDFDLVRLRDWRGRLAEVGMLHITAGWRQPAILDALWLALKPFLMAHGLDRVIGSAGAPLRGGGRQVAERWGHGRHDHLASPEFRTRARLPLPLPALALEPRRPLREGLLQACLQRGAWLLGPPGLSVERGRAELPLMLRLGAFQELARTSSIVVTPASTFSMPS